MANCSLLVLTAFFAVLSISVAQQYNEYFENGPSSSAWEVPEGVTLGQIGGLATNSDNFIHVFHRGSRTWTDGSFGSDNVFQEKDKGPIKENTFLIIDGSTGEVAAEGGAGRFYMPHGMSIDHEDNVWVTDVALHQVFKFPKGSNEPSLTLGKAFEPGTDSEHFCKPTDVAVASNGFFFVADGYCNGRVMMFDPEGNYVTSIGKPDLTNTMNASAPDGTLLVPHSVALVEDWNMICVADREHKRIQCFSAGLDIEHKPLPPGTFLKKSPGLGRVFAIRQRDHMLVGVTNNGNGDDLVKHAPNQLFLYNMETRQAATVDDIELTSPHALTISQDGSLYVGELDPPRLVKVSL